MPRPTEPAAQPTSAPAPTDPAVTPPSSAPAPAGSNDERGLGSIGASITNLVTAKTGLRSPFLADFVRSPSACPADPRQRRQRRNVGAGATFARASLRGGRADPRRLPAG